MNNNPCTYITLKKILEHPKGFNDTKKYIYIEWIQTQVTFYNQCKIYSFSQCFDGSILLLMSIFAWNEAQCFDTNNP